MNRAERQAAMETHPGVTRLKTAHQCEGWKSGTTLRQFQSLGGAPRCKNPAYWRFVPLKRKSMGLFEPSILCWSHLIHQGVYGDMDEMARTQRWLVRRGYA
jgi:hypothetical protein